MYGAGLYCLLVNPAMQVVLTIPGSARPKKPQPTKKCTTRIHALGSDDATNKKCTANKKQTNFDLLLYFFLFPGTTSCGTFLAIHTGKSSKLNFGGMSSRIMLQQKYTTEHKKCICQPLKSPRCIAA